MRQLLIPIQKLSNEVSIPQFATPHSAGMDIHAAVRDVVPLEPGERKLIPTGFAIALPEGYEAQIRSRSGLALKHGVIVFNAPGTIDSDYRGEVGIILGNLGKTVFLIEPNMRIAQMVIAQYQNVHFEEMEELSNTRRNAGGFGSTGV